MRMELAMIEKIEMYIMGTMDDTQKNAFENSLNSNAELQTQTNFQIDLMEGIVRFGLKNASRQAYRKYNLKKWLFRLSILLLLLLTVSTVIIMSTNNSEQSTESSENPITNQENIILPETDSTGISDSTHADTTAFIATDTMVQKSTIKSSPTKSQPENTTNNLNSNDELKIESTSNIENKPDDVKKTNQTTSSSVIQQQEEERKLVCQWKIHQETNKEQLNRIVNEIEACNGKIETSAVNYKNGGVSKISFVVSNKSGKVEYHSPDLREGFIICINFYDEGISVGLCDERLNEFEQKDNNRDGISNSIKSNQQLTTDASDRMDNPGKNKHKRKRFFKQTEKFESGRKRGDYKTKKKYYR